ncbi:MAG: methyltransferase domain-containing protein [Actinobacteria bacterium]|nr:methyltransferase domain-containing protein [Actinomycetota bacterium]
MDVELARWLVSPDAADALAEADAQHDPGSLAAATALRRHWPPDRAAAVLTQAALRRKAVAKFGERAAQLFLTPDGLEQATRGDVAAWRARRFADAGATEVVDLGCGIGADALALRDAGLAVVAVDRDPATAVLAQANLGPQVSVHVGRAEDLADDLLAGGGAVFVDPARRTGAGRTWRVADFSPPWEFATGLLAGRVGCVKAAPGIPSGFLPDSVATTWVSHRGDLVETSLWAGPWAPGSRTAVVLPAGDDLDAGDRQEPPVGPVGRYLYEPDPAVIRSGGVAVLAGRLDAHVPRAGIAYLFAVSLTPTPFATAFEVLDELPYDEGVLRRHVREQGIGTLEIKVRGLDVDPAVLRRRLKPAGPASATLVLTPTPAGARALVVTRLR